MPLPHEFIPGEVARSADVNENFAYIISLLGPLTTPDRVRTTTEFQMGARQNVLMTGTHDSGAAAQKFFQIGWNADWNFTNGKWRFSRFIQGDAATAVRLGNTGFEVYTTSDTNGELESPLQTPSLAVRRTSDGNFVFIPSTMNITRQDGGTFSLSDYRLTYVAYGGPQTIHEGAWGSGSETFDAKRFSVPTSAKAVSITCEVAAGSSAARCRFMQSLSSPAAKNGFTVSAPANSIGSGFGIVPLGEGSRAGDFRVERTASFTSVNAYLTGYWV